MTETLTLEKYNRPMPMHLEMRLEIAKRLAIHPHFPWSRRRYPIGKPTARVRNEGEEVRIVDWWASQLGFTQLDAIEHFDFLLFETQIAADYVAMKVAQSYKEHGIKRYRIQRPIVVYRFYRDRNSMRRSEEWVLNGAEFSTSPQIDQNGVGDIVVDEMEVLTFHSPWETIDKWFIEKEERE